VLRANSADLFQQKGILAKGGIIKLMKTSAENHPAS
jgi:hypothetical protein